MEEKRMKSWAIVLAALLFPGLAGTAGWSATGSCQIRTEGKLDCMEFTGELPEEMLKMVCNVSGDPHTSWVNGPCPQEDLLGFCEVPRNDNVQQRVYCYRMTDYPDTQTLEFCRMSCNGPFSVVAPGLDPQESVPGEVSADAAPENISVEVPGEDTAPESAPVEIPQETSETFGETGETGETEANEPQADEAVSPAAYVMEPDTNRYGEDYKDLDLDSPDPALCAEACANEPECQAWTYVKPGVQAENARCWLKNTVPPASPDENCVSGVKK